MTRGSGSTISVAFDGCGVPCRTFHSEMPAAALTTPTSMVRIISRKVACLEFISVTEPLYFDS